MGRKADLVWNKVVLSESNRNFLMILNEQFMDRMALRRKGFTRFDSTALELLDLVVYDSQSISPVFEITPRGRQIVKAYQDFIARLGEIMED
jgi:hypothetical protein